jgi:hypothetical protein
MNSKRITIMDTSKGQVCPSQGHADVPITDKRHQQTQNGHGEKEMN